MKILKFKDRKNQIWQFNLDFIICIAPENDMSERIGTRFWFASNKIQLFVDVDPEFIALCTKVILA